MAFHKEFVSRALTEDVNIKNAVTIKESNSQEVDALKAQIEDLKNLFLAQQAQGNIQEASTVKTVSKKKGGEEPSTDTSEPESAS